MRSIKGFKTIHGIHGVTAIILFRNKALLLKRRRFPFIANPGIWAFLSGGIERAETPEHALYREIEEETGLMRKDLAILQRCGKTAVFDKRKVIWHDRLYVLRSSSARIRLSMENAGFRWASAKEIKGHVMYKNVFLDEGKIISLLERHTL